MEKMKKNSERTCVTCGGVTEKASMLRWVNIKGTVSPDWMQKVEGRSVYTHFSRDCIEGLIMMKRLPSRFAEEFTGFASGKEETMAYVAQQAKRSLDHFISLSLKSGNLVKGQELITVHAKKGTRFKYCIAASDLSERTFSGIAGKLSIPVKRTSISKETLGLMIDGRPCGIFALYESELSEKVRFYLDLVENFISGDINAHQ